MKKQVIELEKLLSSEVYEIIGKREREFIEGKPIDEASVENLAFCSKTGKTGISAINMTSASVIICHKSLLNELPKKEEKTYIAVNNPKLTFIRCMKSLFPVKTKTGIQSSAIIGENVQFGDDVYIGPYVCIEDNVTIGDNTKIFSHSHIFKNVRIGDGVTLKSGCVIGSDGFGFEKTEDGSFERFQYRGSVIIENDVEIGVNTCIDKGSLSNTIISEGTKIDNLVHVAHNVKTGRNCRIVCLVGIGGSTIIGDNVWIGMGAQIHQGTKIGNNAFVEMGANVTKDVPDNGRAKTEKARLGMNR